MTISKPLIAMIAAALIICVAVAAYTMSAPPSDPVDVHPAVTPTATPTPSPTQQPQATLSKVSVSATSITVGSSLTLTTTVSDATSGLTVTFFNNLDTAVGTAVTDASGTATLTFQPAQGTWTFYATATHP